MRKSIIEERKSILEEYLNTVINNVNLSEFQNLLDFIELDKEIIPLMRKKAFSLSDIRKDDPELDVKHLLVKKHKTKSMDSRENTLEVKEKNKKLVDDFLTSLEANKEEISDKIDHFWEYIRVKWPSFEKDDVLKLFYGNGGILKGLFFHCGDNLENNSLGAENCLNFLNRLIMYDYNPECEKYISCLRMSNIEHISKLNLNRHIQNNKILVTEDCFNIINKLVDNNERKGIDIKHILCHEYLDKYNRWLDLKEHI